MSRPRREEFRAPYPGPRAVVMSGSAVYFIRAAAIVKAFAEVVLR